MTCAHCTDADRVFGRSLARFELIMYRLFGPRRSTRILVERVRELVGDGVSLLDVGGGIGVVQHRLADRLDSGTAVDAAPAYVTLSARLASDHGYADRMSFVTGDFLDVADDVDEHDVVTLDRVLCCYPDLEALVAATAGRARVVYAIVIPRDRALTHVVFGGTNAMLRLRRSAFRTFVHATDRVDGAVGREGLRLMATKRLLLWQVRLYVRSEAIPGGRHADARQHVAHSPG